MKYFSRHFTKFDDRWSSYQIHTKNRIPNTYEMSVKISQNSAKLNSSKNTYQTIKCELSFLPGNSWKWDLVALFGLVSQYHRKLDFFSFSIKQVQAQLQHNNWIWKQLTIQLDCTKFLSLAYILLRLSSLFSRYSKLVSTGMHKLLRSSKILLQHVLVHKNEA